MVGWSFGGICAFEIARLVMEAGGEVALLCVIDVPAGMPQRDLARERADLTRKALDELARSRGHAVPTSELLESMAAIDLEEEVLTTLGYDEVSGLMKRLLRSATVWSTYVPDPLDCDILFYEATGVNWPWNLVSTWQPVVRSIEHRPIPGQHNASLTEPRVRSLAREIAEMVHKSR
jgi:thioesterase domain-containing protein